MYRKILCATAVLVLLLVSAAPARANAMVFIDAPKANATVPTSFVIGGWAIDLASRSGSGISTMHVWAYPATGANPIFIGEITYGARKDVAAAFGPQYMNAGYSIIVRHLDPGAYMVVVFPFSSISNAFDYNAVATLNVNVVSQEVTAPAPVAAPAPTPAPAPAPSGPVAGGQELRVLQWNTHHGGFGTDNLYSPDRIASWVAQMNPDVVTFNELERYTYWGNEDQPEVYKALLQQKTGKTWYYVWAQEFGQWSASGKGNIIYSTYPINASDRYELARNADRSVAMASITVNGQPITVISTHLDPYDPALRLAQASEVTSWSAAQPENRIVTGDMNGWPDQAAIGKFNESYYDSWTVAANNGSTVTFSGNSGQTKSGRIDYIFYSKRSANLSVKSSQVVDTRDAGGVMPSDHRPVLTTFIVK